jgi:hypothetical protein
VKQTSSTSSSTSTAVGIVVSATVHYQVSVSATLRSAVPDAWQQHC